MINSDQIAELQKTVWDYYQTHKRTMMWRDAPTPYNVLVSELMLQQTQVARVSLKFKQFIKRFPDATSLAAAPFSEVLARWSGLGYNRRAKFLWEAAKKVVHDYNGVIPDNYADLVTLPGVGPNTAGAILAYAFQQPVTFIETNIRTVVIHHFFADTEKKVNDAQIKAMLRQILPADNPREWYWALMDYGTHLKATVGSQLQKVQSYRKQSAFEGSRRQVRGEVLRALLNGGQTTEQLALFIDDSRLQEVLDALHGEGLLQRTATAWHLTEHEV